MSLEIEGLRKRFGSVVALDGLSLSSPRGHVFAKVWDLAHDRAGIRATRRQPTLAARSTIPYLNEPWYC